MTRINCIPPSELCNKHLVAEYREMLRLRHANIDPDNRKDIPDTYRMGRGHVKFFYDKGLYLIKRHRQLKNEMQLRGMNPRFSLDLSSWDEWRMNDWEPDEKSQFISKKRISDRLSQMT